MPQQNPLKQKKISTDWLVGGVLTKLGDTFDRFTGRRWVASSSIATSELIERIKKLLDSESKSVPGKGTVVPHNIKLKMQWDKFSDDAEAALQKLRFELLTATIDHINDSLYYTYAPVVLYVKPDYFVEGVKLYASFDKFTEEDRDVEMNVTVPAIDVSHLIPVVAAPAAPVDIYIARFEIKDAPKEMRLEFHAEGSLSVGRTGTNALMIDDASVSKIHASLSVDGEGHLSVADTGSTNGTFINDVRIAYGKATVLGDGDHVKFGVIGVEFEHVPRPIVIDTPQTASDEAHDGDTMEIDGFEFKRRASPDLPEPEELESPGENLQETSPAIPIPSRTFSIPPVKTEDALNNIDEAKMEKPAAIEEKTETVVEDESDDEPETKFKH